MDRYATHSHPTVQQRLERNPHLVMHFRPTSESGLNMVERVSRNSFPAVAEPEMAIDFHGG